MEFFKDNQLTIYNGDALKVLKTFEDESINCIVTSPPYWALRDYQTKPQIWDADKNCEHEWGGDFCVKCGAWKGSFGLEPTFDLYIKHLCNIFDEVKRVLRKDGTCWINLGDSYSNSGGSGSGEYQKRHKQFGKIINQGTAQEPHRALGLPFKSLCLIPQRFAIEMTNRGWILRNEIIWHKPNCMPSSAKDRFTVDFEKIFFFVKSKKYWFEQVFEDIKEETKRDKRTINGYKNIRGRSWDKDPNSLYTPMGSMKVNPQGRNKRAVWTIPTRPFKEAHFAVFPEELIITPIKAGCPEKGIVLDPFMGSGTTCLVANKLNRKAIGIELNKEYCEIADKRCAQEIFDLSG